MLSSSPALAVFAGLFLVGAALFALGTWLTRRPDRAAKEAAHSEITWTQELGGAEQLPWELRMDMIERLAIVGQPWCVDLLKLALEEETDNVVRDAADRALLVIATR